MLFRIWDKGILQTFTGVLSLVVPRFLLSLLQRFHRLFHHLLWRHLAQRIDGTTLPLGFLCHQLRLQNFFVQLAPLAWPLAFLF